jgi:beta-galactosidase
LDSFHKLFPNSPFIVSEYGADADSRIRCAEPVRFDKSVEYTTGFHQYYFTEIMKRPFVAGSVIWNLADFNSETREETMPHMNNKGLLEWDRTPKDPYYFYEAVLSKNPFIKILGCCCKNFGIADSAPGFCNQTVQIASNLDSVFVELNKSYQIKLKVTNGLCAWELPFKNGLNTIVVEGERNSEKSKDSIAIQFHVQPRSLTDKKYPFSDLNIMLGTARCFIDKKGEWWQPDQEYSSGGWGSIGGKKFKIANNGRLPYGTDRNILGTDDDPVYQTQQTGIRQYRLDVPPGEYEVILHFAELPGGEVKVKRRIFTVNVNGRTLLDHLNIADDYGVSKAVIKSATVTVNDDKGIFIDFAPVEGEPILNALQVRKIDAGLEK